MNIIPSSIPGLQVWIDANDPNCYTLSGSNITQLKDKSGLANNTTSIKNGQPTFQTNVINGLPVFNFPYGGFLGNISNTNTSNSLSFFMIIAVNSYSNNYGRILTLGNGVNATGQDYNNIQEICFTGATPGVNISRNSTLGFTSPTMNLNNFYLVSCYFDGINAYLGINGTYTSFASTGNFNITKYGFGTDLYISNFSSYFKSGELLVYNTALSTSNRQQIEGYLALKWGLNYFLPQIHPYYTADWLYYGNTSNQYIPTYFQNFVDICGNMIIRNGNFNIIGNDISLNGLILPINANISNLNCANNIIAYDISCANNILINGNAYFNKNTFIKGNLNTNSMNLTNIDVSLNGNLYTTNDIICNSNNILIQNMTVGTLKPNNLGNITSCGAGYSIVNYALTGNTLSTLQNNVIIGGNVASYCADVNNSTLVGTLILNKNTNIISGVTAIGYTSGSGTGDKTNSTFIGYQAGSGNSVNQTNNTSIGHNSLAGNDADSQTSIGYNNVKTVAQPNWMFIGSISYSSYVPGKLSIGPVPGNLGLLNVDGSGVFIGGNVFVTDLSLNIDGASYKPSLASVGSSINAINTTGFMINASYVGSWTTSNATTGQGYFGMMGGIQSDASSVIVMPSCIVYTAYASSKVTVTGTNLYLSVLKNGVDVVTTSNQITFTSGNTVALANSVSGFASGTSNTFSQGDEMSVRFPTVAGGTAINAVFTVQFYCKYF